MTRHDMDDQLSELLHDAVADVEPSERLSELHARTASSTTSRRWWVGAGGAALATAAVVTAIAVVGTDPPTAVDPPPAGQSTSEPTTPPTDEGRAVAAYFVGDTPRGPRLYREFQQVVDPTPGLAGLELLESGPNDPDYRSLWPAGSFESVSDPQDGLVTVQLGDGAPAEPSALALQQVVHTVSAGFQEPLMVDLDTGTEELGPISAEPPLDVLSHVSLSDPFEGQVVAGDTLRVNGVANSYEANVLWTLESDDGSSGNGGQFTALGYMEERLFPFSGKVDVSSLDPGTYTLTVETDDPSGGAEGNGSFSDTRTVVIE